MGWHHVTTVMSSSFAWQSSALSSISQVKEHWRSAACNPGSRVRLNSRVSETQLSIAMFHALLPTRCDYADNIMNVSSSKKNTYQCQSSWVVSQREGW